MEYGAEEIEEYFLRNFEELYTFTQAEFLQDMEVLFQPIIGEDENK